MRHTWHRNDWDFSDGRCVRRVVRQRRRMQRLVWARNASMALSVRRPQQDKNTQTMRSRVVPRETAKLCEATSKTKALVDRKTLSQHLTIRSHNPWLHAPVPQSASRGASLIELYSLRGTFLSAGSKPQGRSKLTKVTSPDGRPLSPGRRKENN